MAATRKATHRLINSVWTIEFSIQDGKAFIHNYSRDDAFGYDYERDIPQASIVEDDERTARELLVKPYDQWDTWANDKNATERYEIANPAFIFSYSR